MSFRGRAGGLTPIGGLILWYGDAAAIPAGWALCDGTNGTPDLRGRIPVGVDPGQAEFDTLGKTGGAKTVTLSTGQIPGHNHTQDSHGHGVTDPAHRHGFDGDTGFRYVVTTPAGTDHANTAAGGTQTPISFGAMDTATTGVTVNGATATNQAAGGGGSHTNLQPYLALHFIMRTS